MQECSASSTLLFTFRVVTYRCTREGASPAHRSLHATPYPGKPSSDAAAASVLLRWHRRLHRRAVPAELQSTAHCLLGMRRRKRAWGAAARFTDCWGLVLHRVERFLLSTAADALSSPPWYFGRGSERSAACTACPAALLELQCLPPLATDHDIVKPDDTVALARPGRASDVACSRGATTACYQHE